MRKIMLAAAGCWIVLAGTALAQTTTTTTTTWTNDQGSLIREYSTTRRYAPITDPALKPSEGSTLPDSVTLYPLPDTISLSDPNRYSYTIINDQPVVVERTTRRVVHTWQ